MLGALWRSLFAQNKFVNTFCCFPEKISKRKSFSLDALQIENAITELKNALD